MKNKIISTILALCCFVMAPAATAAETGKIEKNKYLQGAFVLLPARTKMKFEWALAPRDNKEPVSADDIKAQFSIDGRGKTWLSRDNNMLADITDGFILRTGEQFKGFAFLDSGMLYLATEKYLGFIAEPDKKASPDKNGIIDVSLRPLAGLPAQECAIFPGEGNLLYLNGHDNENGMDNVYIFGEKGSVVKAGDKGSTVCFKEIFSAKKPITAVAGDGKKTYIAMGRMILELNDGVARGYFVHPTDDITGLAFSSVAGLFYSTASCVGYAGANGCIDFIKLTQPHILMRKNILYVFVPDDFGVLRISNVEDMKKHDFKSKKKTGLNN
jgi:hypothetical protein